MALNPMKSEIPQNEMMINAMDMSETYQATASIASIQLRTHPTHATINFSELGKKLLESARNGDTDEVLELINTGAPFTTDWLGASPLHYAAQYGHVDTVETLLRSGIAKDARTKIDRTALHVAAQEGYLETVNVLVTYGCDVDAKDMLKMTPLHWAVQRGHREIMEVLLNHGADVKVVNKFDKTPMDIAYSNGHEDFLPLLQSFKGKAKPKLNPIDAPIPMRLMKPHQPKRPKSQNMNRSISKVSHIKQEIDEESDMKLSMESFKTVKRDNNLSNGQLNPFNKSSDGKLVIQQQNTSNSISSNNQNQNINSSMSKKFFTFNSQSPNLVLLSNNSAGSKSDSGIGPIKVVTKKPVFTELKNSKTIQVDKNFPFFNAKHPPPVIKRYVINTNQNSNSQLQGKDEEIRKLQDDMTKLKRELEEYKSLIISKDLEIEKLKKQLHGDE